MTSQKKIQANRANSKKSTGPGTKHGRARVSQNARRHGLSVPIFADAACSAEIERMANEIVSQSENRETIELARRVAEAETDLARIRQARHSLLERNGGLNKVAEDVLKQLIAIDRYERRAVSRRNFAMRELGCLFSS
jgi:hypothetical protein